MGSGIEISAGTAESIEPSEIGTALVVPISGELDMSTRDFVESVLMAAIASAPRVICDLAALTFCDSSGIAMFIAVHEKAVAEGSEFALRHVIGSTRRVLEMTGTDQILHLIP